MHDLVTIAFPIFMTAIVGFYVWSVKRRMIKQDEAHEKRDKERAGLNKKVHEAYLVRAEARRKESLLLLEVIDSIGKIAFANSIAIQGNNANGEIDLANKSYKISSKRLTSFLRETAIESYIE